MVLWALKRYRNGLTICRRQAFADNQARHVDDFATSLPNQSRYRWTMR
jgi:hypothetical protein